MAKGKQVDSKAAGKLTRNEDKLIKVKESGSKFISDLCLLMEEVTERSWRDLHPMLVKCAQFEGQVSSDEAKAFESMNEVVTALKKVASEHGIKPQARLKDLQTADPTILSTRSKDDSRNLAIENGFAGMALGGSAERGIGGSEEAMHFPPGSTHAQGLGGFPVRVQSNDMTNELSNSTSAPLTMNMMNINAAPAPTLDTMVQAFGSGGASKSAPNSGGLSQNDFEKSRQFSSMDSLHSDYNNGTLAPPPMAAPPPPPPQASMTGGYDQFRVPPTGTPISMGTHGNNHLHRNNIPQGGNFAQQQPMYEQSQYQYQQQQQLQQQQQQQQYNQYMPSSHGVNNGMNTNTNPFG